MQSIVAGKKGLDPPAFNYDNLVGFIWMEDTSQYSYDKHYLIGVADPYSAQGGYYDKR
jgi:hypothetical protein